jgi:aspartate carbamoyltransferase regulatory subunit
MVPKQQVGVALLISDKINFQLNVINRDKEGHFIHIKGKIDQEDLSILNIYAPNASVPHIHKRNFTKD